MRIGGREFSLKWKVSGQNRRVGISALVTHATPNNLELFLMQKWLLM